MVAGAGAAAAFIAGGSDFLAAAAVGSRSACIVLALLYQNCQPLLTNLV